MTITKPTTSNPLYTDRVYIKGKFLYAGDQKFYAKGVTYGTFRPDENGLQFPEKELVEKDFALMTKYGFNSVRTYTVPPKYLLDAALENGLKIMVGLPWEQHITFLDSPKRINDIFKRVKQFVIDCNNHPAIMCYAIGNEIPASIVRWYGNKRIEQFLHKLYKIVKRVDPQGLVTYVNYPTTEYLKLPFLDFDCFNVYLETKEKLSEYLQRLHNLSVDRPLVLAEIGMDSMRNGVEKQAEVLNWQLRTIFNKGSAGSFVFAWTDEWWRGGFDIEDWDFGLVDRQRHPKPALETVTKAYAEIPFSGEKELPFISVLVCSYNGSSTIRDTMEGLLKLDYSNFEVIIVNDGSTDNLQDIVTEYPFQLINTQNQGLSSARNTALMHAKGEIVAYIDDDAYPDPHWLRYIAYAYQTSNHAGIGGPNIAPDDDGPIATCVTHAPGGPVHVLLSDEIAEHIPGCNMSFRRDVLLDIGGFDPVFRAAGDDVDICWRIQHSGRTIGYHPSALVWHHRRNSVKAYWKQQKGYGKAEALLEAKWIEKYNKLGHLSWTGRIYGNGITLPITLKKDKIFYGVWGTAPFQSIYQHTPGFINYIPLMPEWNLFIIVLGFLSLMSIFWIQLLWVLPVFLLLLTFLYVQAGVSAAKSLKKRKFHNKKYIKYWILTTLLHVAQPMARLYGRITYGLTPWRKRGSNFLTLNLLFKNKISLTMWSEKWKALQEWLYEIESNLIKSRVRVRRGGTFDRWDLHVSCGFFSSARALLTIEEHGGGKQLLRIKCRPHYSRTGIILLILLSILSYFALLEKNFVAGSILGSLVLILMLTIFADKARAMFDLNKAFIQLSASESENELSTETVSEQAQVFADINIPFSDISATINNSKEYIPDDDFRLKRVLSSGTENGNELKTI